MSIVLENGTCYGVSSPSTCANLDVFSLVQLPSSWLTQKYLSYNDFFNYYYLILIFLTSYYIMINNRLMSIKGAGFLPTVLQLCH